MENTNLIQSSQMIGPNFQSARVLAQHEADREGMELINNCFDHYHEKNETIFLYDNDMIGNYLNVEEKSVRWDGHKYVWDKKPY